MFSKKFLQLDMTLYVVECLLPDYMAGLSQLYNASHIHKYYDGDHDGDGDEDHDNEDGGDEHVHHRHSKHKGGSEKLSLEARNQMEER